MKKTAILLTSLTLSIASFSQKPTFILQNVSTNPLIKQGDKGTEDIKKGFEGGMVTKVNGEYHGFFTERVSKPRTLLTRLGYWKSIDGNTWKRMSTLYTSTGNPDGTDPRATLFAPMVSFNEKDNQWEIYYVAYIYNAFPGKGYNHMYGRIWRGISTVKGKEGIGGPYKDAGIVLQPDGDMQPWEGAQGVDSFYPYQVGNVWYGFYGTANTETMPEKNCNIWTVGLASSTGLGGVWKRLESGNPVNKRWMIENPIVIKVKDYYVAVADILRNTESSESYNITDLCVILISKDGVNWQESQIISGTQVPVDWYIEARTPLSLIDEGNGIYSVFFTAYKNYNDFAPVGKFTLKMEYK